ncbi:MAG: hypothetical protein R2734_14185 [Nocardioides sp.]
MIGDANPDLVVSGVPELASLRPGRAAVDFGIELVVGGSASITAQGGAARNRRRARGRRGDDALGGWLRERLSDAEVDASRVRATSAAGTGASGAARPWRGPGDPHPPGRDQAALARRPHGLPDLPARHVRGVVLPAAG